MSATNINPGSLDFRIKERYNKYYDCLIICDNKKYYCHRIYLSKIEYFDKYFDNNYKKEYLDNIIVCRFNNNYSNIINIFLNQIYADIKINTIYIMDIIYFYDYICWNEKITYLINSFNSSDISLYTKIIEYLDDKIKLFKRINKQDIYTSYAILCIKKERLDLLDNIKIKYINLFHNSMIMVKPIDYMKLVNYMYNKLGSCIFESIDNERFMDIGIIIRLNDEVKEYLNNMDDSSELKNFIGNITKTGWDFD